MPDQLGQLVWQSGSSQRSIRGLAAENGTIVALSGYDLEQSTYILRMTSDGSVTDGIATDLPSQSYAAIRDGVLHLVRNEGYDDDPFRIYR